MNLRQNRLLIIEDDLAQIGDMIARLERSSWTVETATTMSAARDKLIQTAYSLIVVDVGLPNELGEAEVDDGGLRLIRELDDGICGERNRDTPFAILTNHVSRDQVAGGGWKGGNEAIGKKFRGLVDKLRKNQILRLAREMAE